MLLLAANVGLSCRPALIIGRYALVCKGFGTVCRLAQARSLSFQQVGVRADRYAVQCRDDLPLS